MPKKSVPKDRPPWQRRAAALSAKVHSQLKGTFKGFRPRRKEERSFVFVGLDGKRIDSKVSSRKGFMAYVYRTKTGKTTYKVVTEKHGSPLAKRPQSYKLADTRLKTATKKYYAEEMVQRSGTVSTKGRQRNINYTKVIDKISRQLKSQSAGQRQITAMVKVSGRRKPIRAFVSFGKQERQKISKHGYREFSRRKLYAAIAAELDQEDKVSQGSANYIRQLKCNKGKAPREWRNKNGERWGKHNYEIVKVQAISWQISMSKIRSK